MNDPLGTFLAALGSAWGRAFSFGFAILAASLFAFGLSSNSVGYLPIIFIGSVWSGWGLILYPALLIGFALYVSRESSPLWLVPVIVFCYADFRHTANSLAEALRWDADAGPTHNVKK